MRRRIIICLGLLLALCLLGDVFAMVCLHQSIGQLTLVSESHRIQSMRAELATNAVRLESNMYAHLDGHSHGAVSFEEAGQRFQESERQCFGCHHEASIQVDVDALHASFKAYEEALAVLFTREAAEPNRPRPQLPHDPLEQRLEKLADDIARQAGNLADRAAYHLAFQGTGAVTYVRNAWIALIVTLAAMLFVGGFVALHLEKRLTRPVASLLEGIELARNGDLGHEFAFKGDKEFRALAHAFENAYRSLDTAHTGIVQAEKMAAVGRLATGVAHEVGNPLASISAIMQVMRRSASDALSVQIDQVMSEIERISRIIRQLLRFARPAEGTAHDRVDVGALVNRATELLAYDKRAARIELTCNCENLPMILGDADELQAVFANIILNAFDAVGNHADGRGMVAITGNCEGEHVVIRFRDNGPGMDEEQLAKAFEPFFTTKQPGVGTGLGLWISYRVVQQHHGAIELHSRQGVGATVVVKLPWRRLPVSALVEGGDGI